MNSITIERKGIRAVSEYLEDTGYISPYLSENDKTPMWDGTIFVYNTKEEFKNEQFAYRVPVQVKASEFDGEEYPKTTSYAIEITVLNNYLDDGGLAFFKVLVNKKGNQIYSAFLTKADIEKIMSSSEDNQQTKTILLSKAPEDTNELLNNLRRIYLLRNHEQLDLSVLEKHTGYSFSFRLEHLSKETDPLQYMATHYIDVLFKLDGIPGEFYPKGGPVNLQIISTIKKPVIVGRKVFYDSFKCGYQKDGNHFIMGCLELILPYEKTVAATTINISFCPSTIKDAINDYSFILSVVNCSEIKIGDKTITLNKSSFHTAPIKEWKEQLTFWKNVKLLFSILKIQQTISPVELKDNDYKNLKTLIQAFLNHKVVYGDCKETHFNTIAVGKLNILVFAKYIKGREFRLYDVYDYLSVVYIDEKEIERPAPVLSMVLERETLPTNIPLSNLPQLYKSFKQRNPHISYRANLDLLALLNHYDKTQEERLIIAAKELATWLKNEKKSCLNRNTTFLNYLQTMIRLRGSLTESEKYTLSKMKTEDNSENYAKYILLGNRDKAVMYLSKIDSEELKQFMKLPIYHFMNQ